MGKAMEHQRKKQNRKHPVRHGKRSGIFTAFPNNILIFPNFIRLGRIK